MLRKKKAYKINGSSKIYASTLIRHEEGEKRKKYGTECSHSSRIYICIIKNVYIRAHADIIYIYTQTHIYHAYVILLRETKFSKLLDALIARKWVNVFLLSCWYFSMYNRCLFRDKMVRNRREGKMRGNIFSCKGEWRQTKPEGKRNEIERNAKLERRWAKMHSSRPLPPISSSLDRESSVCNWSLVAIYSSTLFPLWSQWMQDTNLKHPAICDLLHCG